MRQQAQGTAADFIFFSQDLFFHYFSMVFLEAACSVGSEEIEVLVWLAGCLQLPWDWLSASGC